MDRVTRTVVFRTQEMSVEELQQRINDVEESGEGWSVYLVSRSPSSVLIVFQQNQGVLFV